MSRTPELFERIDPPAGGLDDLRRRLARERVREVRLRTGRRVAGAVAIVAALALTWPLVRPRRAPVAELDLVRMRLGLVAPPQEALLVADASGRLSPATRVPGENDRVTFYRVASTRTAPDLEGEFP